MRTRLLLLGLFVTLVAIADTASADDRMYLCQDGTFTNRPERLCKPYVSSGVVMTLPQGQSLHSLRAVLGEPEPTRQLPESPAICQLYDEWVALNLRTGGGVSFQLTQDRPRWIALSRIFTAIGTPRCQ